MSVAVPSVATRCAVHPARPAADDCPVCGRARCGADAAEYGARGCVACAHEVRHVPPSSRELLVRAALAAFGAALVGAWIAAQYVDTQYFSVVAPGLVALGCVWAASAAASTARTSRTVAMGIVAGLLATGLSDRLVPGGQNLFLPPGHRLPPYLAAVIGALAWPILFGPPRPRTGDQPAGRGMRRK